MKKAIAIIGFLILFVSAKNTFADGQKHHDFYFYYTVYLKNGEKIKVYDERKQMTTAMWDKDVNFTYNAKTDKYTLINDDGKNVVANKDIDHYVVSRYKSDKLVSRNYRITLPNQGKEYTGKEFHLQVILKTEKYYLCAMPGYTPSQEITYYYYVVDMERNTLAVIGTAKFARKTFPEYFGDLPDFIDCLSRNNYKTNKCYDGLVFLAAWKYANEYFKDTPFYDDDLTNCQKKILAAQP